MQLLNYGYKQRNNWTCGPAMARVILDYYGIETTIPRLNKQLRTNRSGTAHKHILKLFDKNKLKFFTKEKASLSDLKKYMKKYWIVVAYWIPFHQEYHYSIVTNVHSKTINFHDTWFGSKHKYTLRHFCRNWRDDESSQWMLAVKK